MYQSDLGGGNLLGGASENRPTFATSAPGGGVVIVLSRTQSLREILRPVSELGFQVQFHLGPELLLVGNAPQGAGCVLVDGRDEGNQLRLCSELKGRGWHLPTIVLASNLSVGKVVRLMRAGADDVLAWPVPAEELLEAVHQAIRHSRERLHSELQQLEVHNRWASLTERERQVVGLVLAGMLNKQIAGELGLAVITVKVHRGSAMRKLGAKSAAELARYAWADEWIQTRTGTSRATLRGPAQPSLD